MFRTEQIRRTGNKKTLNAQRCSNTSISIYWLLFILSFIKGQLGDDMNLFDIILAYPKKLRFRGLDPWR